MFTNVNSMHYVHTIMINFNMRSLACIYVYASLDDQPSRWRLDRTQWIILFPVVSPFIQKFSRMSRKVCNSFFSNFHTKFNDNRRSHIIKIKSKFWNLYSVLTKKLMLGILTIFNPLSWHRIVLKLGIIIPKAIKSPCYFLCNF